MPPAPPGDGDYAHLFGPVPSRRLGRSLGIDLVPHKVCTLDCRYCECGATTQLTRRRREWVPTADVKTELARWFAADIDVDHLTFSGAGEPTLHSDLGRILVWMRERAPQHRLALLTNGTLLDDPDLRAELRPLDVIVPSLDAVDERIFAELNRPLPGLTAATLVDSLVALRADFEGELWLEILLVDGVNDAPDELDRLAAAIERIGPNKVQLNTAVRPGSDPTTAPASAETLDRALRRFGSIAEPVATFPVRHVASADADAAADPTAAVLAVLRRRPETVASLAASLDLPEAELQELVAELVDAGSLQIDDRPTGRYYRAKA